MPTSGPIRRGRSSTQIGEGVIRRGRVATGQAGDDHRLDGLEARAAQQAQQLATAAAAIAALERAQLGLVADIRPQAVVDRTPGVYRVYLGDPWRWEPLTLFELLARASLRG